MKYLTTREVAAICGCAQRSVAKWCDRGHLRCLRLPGGTHRRIAADVLVAFLEGHGYAVPEELRELAGKAVAR